MSVFLRFCRLVILWVFCCLFFHEFPSCLLITREPATHFLHCWAYGYAHPLASSPFGRACLAFPLHDRFRPLLETGVNARNVFVLPSYVIFRRLFLLYFKRPAERLVTLVPTCDLFRLLGPARTVVPFLFVSLCHPPPHRRPCK